MYKERTEDTENKISRENKNQETDKDHEKLNSRLPVNQNIKKL